MKPGTKRCPYCGEEIKSVAIKCRYCGSMLTDAPSSGVITGITLVRQALASRYEILEEIGRGGMATVYKAIQKNLQRPVALKVIHQNLIHDSEFVARFHREAQVCASLQHTNIVTVYDEGEVNGVHFMAMELLEGYDLHQLVRQQGKLRIEETLGWVAPIADALNYAHSKGVIHRDIKSSNILVTKSGRSVLMDFGIAYAATGTKLTQTGLVIGTPEYMSPEQAEGHTVDHRSDIYSLGVVLYECLTGQVPFKAGNPLSTIMKVVNEAPSPPIQKNNQIPAWLDKVILRCLAKKPEERFENAGELAKSLLNAEYSVSPSSKKHSKIKPKQTSSGVPPSSSRLGKGSSGNKKKGSVLKVFAWLLFILLLILGGIYLYNSGYSLNTNSLMEHVQQAYNQYFNSDSGNVQNNEAKLNAAVIRQNKVAIKHKQLKQTHKIPANSGEKALYASVIKKNTEQAYRQYLKTYPNGLHSIEIRKRLETIREKPVVKKRLRDPFFGQMVYVKGGTFQMGSNKGESDEKPVHTVTVSDFYIDKYEVTVSQFKAFVAATGYKTDAEKRGYSYVYQNNRWKKKSGADWRCDVNGNLRSEGGYNHPVIHVSWNDASAFCQWLSKVSGKHYRLPTEAEWEFAARGGDKSSGYAYSGSNDLDEVAWYGANSGKHTHSVGTKVPNELGLYDMSGNVWEWCNDWYDETYYSNSPENNPQGPESGYAKVLRGGSWDGIANLCRVSIRLRNAPSLSSGTLGFRVVR